MIKEFNRSAIITLDKEVSYADLLMHISDFATVSPKEKGEKTIVFSENREGWIYAFFSIWANRGIAVPVDASSTVDDVAYILNDCRPACVWTSKEKEPVMREAIAKVGIDIRVELIDERENATVDCEKVTIEHDKQDTAVIIYTSGTTGSPKGVMLSFANLYANMYGVCEEVKIFNSERRTLILLPLHHILPLMGTCIIPIIQGGGVAICPSMSGPDIMATLCRGEVAIMVGVPRLWQTLYTGIKKKIDSNAITRTLFKICAAVKNPALSAFVFQSVRKKMGGHILYCVSGGAALDKEIGNGLVTLGLNVLEGYGMTETAPIIAFTRPGDYIPGCSGLPLPSVTCKIINGELCAKGDNVMQGYYNRPEETAAVIDKDGYVHTGDLARVDAKGRVYITGRTKEIIVLSNGKNVQPNELEYKLEKYDDKVKEAAVVQDGDMLKAIIVPQPVWAEGKTDSEIEEIIKEEVLRPYNLSVSNYKKVMSVFIYRGDLPRTKLDKLQRFKLKSLIDGTAKVDSFKATNEAEPQTQEYQILKNYVKQEKGLVPSPSDHLETDLAFDSLDMVSLQGFIEQTFGLQMVAGDLSGFKNLAAVAEHVANSKTRMEVEEIDWHKMLTTHKPSTALPTAMFTLPIIAKGFNAFFKVYNRLSVKGLDNIPTDEPFILAPNHQSFVDGPLVVGALPSEVIKNCYFYATEEHVQGKVRKALARRHNIILMERSRLKDSILKMAEVLKQGKNLVIFPEGSRTHTGDIGAFKKTFAILSKELQVPIVPVKITGAFEALPRTRKTIRPHKIKVEYMPAIYPGDIGNYDLLSDEVKDAIMKK